MWTPKSWFEKMQRKQWQEKAVVQRIVSLGLKKSSDWEVVFAPSGWENDESLIKPANEVDLSPEEQKELILLQRHRKELHEKILEIQRKHSKELEQIQKLQKELDQKEDQKHQLMLKAPEIENEDGDRCRNISALNPEDKQEWDLLKKEIQEINDQIKKITNS